MMKSNALSRALLKDKNIKRNTFFWNAFSAVMNSFQTMVLLLVITRTGNDNDSGIFVMAYAVGNLMLNVGKYGVRQYQVTDVKEKHSLKDYVNARYASMMIMFIFIGAYLLMKAFANNYTMEKIAVVLIICLVKAVEAFEDVYQGRMQQKGRLDCAGRILGIRLFIFIVMFAILYITTGHLVSTSLICLIATAVISFIMNGSVMYEFKDEGRGSTKESVKEIMIKCFPLCVCMCLNMYITNSPKYIIDSVVSDEVQTKFNIVFMPVFVIALMGNFIFQPFLKRMGENWVEERIDKFERDIGILAVSIIVLDLGVTLVGSFIGGPVLGMIYGVDLKDFNFELILFMLAGGLIALQNLCIMAITTVRYQKYMIYGYIGISVIIFIFGRLILAAYDVRRLSIFFLFAMCLPVLYSLVLVWIAIKNKKEQLNK